MPWPQCSSTSGEARGPDRQACLAHSGQHGARGRGPPAAGYLPPVHPFLAMVGLTLSAMGIYGAIAPFLSMPSAAATCAAAVPGLALVNSLGNLRRLHLPVRRRPPQGRYRPQAERAAVPLPPPVLHRRGHVPLDAVSAPRRRRPSPRGRSGSSPSASRQSTATRTTPEGTFAMTSITRPDEPTAEINCAASARGIGRAAADRRASEGWSIAILDINAEDAAAAAAGSVRTVPQGHRRRPWHVSDSASVDRAITEIEGRTPIVARPTGAASVPDARSWKPLSKRGRRSSPSTCADPSSSQRVLKA